MSSSRPVINITQPISQTPSSTNTISTFPIEPTTTIETNPIEIQPTSTNENVTDPLIPGKSSSPSIQENDRIPIIITISSLVILFLSALIFAYIHGRHKRRRRKNLASAIIAAEEGETSELDYPSPPSPPPTPPSTPTPLPHALLKDGEDTQSFNGSNEAVRPPPRYKISTLQIEPMTKRLTVNLGQKGKSIMINEDRDSNQTRKGSETGSDILEEDGCQEIINIVSLRGDDDFDFYDSDEENGNKGKGSKRFSIRKSFWK